MANNRREWGKTRTLLKARLSLACLEIRYEKRRQSILYSYCVLIFQTYTPLCGGEPSKWFWSTESRSSCHLQLRLWTSSKGQHLILVLTFSSSIAKVCYRCTVSTPPHYHGHHSLFIPANHFFTILLKITPLKQKNAMVEKQNTPCDFLIMQACRVYRNFRVTRFVI